MKEHIMVGCDLHDKNMLLKIAVGRGKADKRLFGNTLGGRRAMVADLKKRSASAGGAEVIFAYEASCQGFGLYDEVTEAGHECHVLAPTLIARSVRHRRSKTDEKDADRILEILRAHVLAGIDLPSVWVPDLQTREDREVVRARLDVADKLARLKAQVRMLLKRNGVRKPSKLGKGWTGAYGAWLLGLTAARSELSHGARVGLASLLRQMRAVEEEIQSLGMEVAALSRKPRYAKPAFMMTLEKGVGQLTAMVFLTEMGDLSRFSNRKQVGCFLGLAPSANESGETSDRKGHITHQGPYRVRKVLCQAVWARVRTDLAAAEAYDRIVSRNPKHKKIAVVAMMRRLAVRLWHVGLETQRASGCFDQNELDAVA